MDMGKSRLVMAVDATHHQQWAHGRYSYLQRPRPNHGLLLLLDGGIDYVDQSQTLHSVPMDLVFLPQGSRYEARFSPGTDDLLINFRILEGSTEDLPTAPFRVTNDTHTLLPLMRQTVLAFQDGPEQQLETMELFYRFCRRLAELVQPISGEQALIRRAKAMLSQPDCPSLDRVAKQLLISPSGLRKKFRDAEGISPSQYRLNQKLENAKRLLLSTDLPVGRIAELCGFCDGAYFHKVFCRLTGMTPTAYRAARPFPY